jgi:ABC-type transporter MlaC component
LTQIKAVGRHSLRVSLGTMVIDMRRAKSVFAAGALLLIVASFAWGESNQADAAKFVRDLADSVLAVFNDPKASRAAKEQTMFQIAVKAFHIPL